MYTGTSLGLTWTTSTTVGRGGACCFFWPQPAHTTVSALISQTPPTDKVGLGGCRREMIVLASLSMRPMLSMPPGGLLYRPQECRIRLSEVNQPGTGHDPEDCLSLRFRT